MLKMSYRAVINFFFVLFLAQGASGQDWFRGSVLLQNGNVLYGEISFWTGRDALFLSEGDVVMAVPAFRIQSFSFFDDESEIERKFVTMPSTHGAATTFQFYEVVVDGTISVLRQQHLYWYSLRLQMSDYDYFVVKDDQFMPINKFRRELYHDLKRNSSALAAFAARERLSLYNIEDNIRLIEYYNEQQTGIASAR
jgi:hypothetical protein